ncbi:MAG: hypothetical protein CSA36_00650 [Draconibacterium sp.]|nr:MAG: hypothetical protein CSA36_00650 [Draconibacterium sp.]
MENKYSKYYSESSLMEKIRNYSKDAGAKVVYAVLLLFYTMKDKGISLKTRLTIAAALGYFILPTDAIFDLTPFIGYSDDLGVLLFALSQITTSITPEIREKARTKVNEWFYKGVDESEFLELEDRIKDN